MVLPTGPAPVEGDVVVGVSPSGSSAQAMAIAFEEASWRRTGLTALHAWDRSRWTITLGLDPADSELRAYRQDSNLLLAESVAGYAENYPDVTVTRRSVDLHVLDALTDACRNAQLVVIARHRQAYVGSLGLGPVARHLVHTAPCPVIVVPPQPLRTDPTDRDGELELAGPLP